jgi:anti-sigma factor RsiW
MKTQITGREWEDLSAYLDGQLSPRQSARLEEKLQARADLRAALNELNQTRSVLRSQPAVRAPRNFTLTPKMVGARQAPPRSFQLFPAMRLASVLAVALFILVLAGDLLTGGRQPGLVPVAYQPEQMSAPAVALESAPEAAAVQTEAVMEAPAPTEAPAQAKMAEAPTQLPAPTMAAVIQQDAGTGAEAYPPPSEAFAASVPALEETTATPPASPQPVAQLPQEANSAERSALQGADASLHAGETAWPGWRFLEIALALLVIVTIGLAFYLRRSRRV